MRGWTSGDFSTQDATGRAAFQLVAGGDGAFGDEPFELMHPVMLGVFGRPVRTHRHLELFQAFAGLFGDGGADHRGELVNASVQAFGDEERIEEPGQLASVT